MRDNSGKDSLLVTLMSYKPKPPANTTLYVEKVSIDQIGKKSLTDNSIIAACMGQDAFYMVLYKSEELPPVEIKPVVVVKQEVKDEVKPEIKPLP